MRSLSRIRHGSVLIRSCTPLFSAWNACLVVLAPFVLLSTHQLSAFSMRDDFLVIIDWQPHLIRAGIGLGTEVIPRPTVVGGYSQLPAQRVTLAGRSELILSVSPPLPVRGEQEIAARVGLRPSVASLAAPTATASSSALGRRASDYLVGQALDEAERSGEELEIIWPLQWKDRDTVAVAGSTASKKGKGAATGDRVQGAEGARSSASDGGIDWVGLEALLCVVITRAAATSVCLDDVWLTCVVRLALSLVRSSSVLTQGLGLSARPINYMFLVTHAPDLEPSSQELLIQLFFEQLGISNLLLVERPLAALYSCASLSGVVIDVGPRSTAVTVIHETQIHHPGMMSCPVGEEDCDEHLARLLVESNPQLPAQLAVEGDALQRALLSIVKTLKDGDYIKYASSGQAGAVGAGVAAGQAGNGTAPDEEEEEEEEGITDVAKALASGKANKIIAAGQASASGVIVLEGDGDQLSVPNPTDPTLPPLTVGPERHRYAEPLFNANVPPLSKQGLPNLPETVARAVQTVPELDKRGDIWSSVVLTGGVSLIRGRSAKRRMQRHAVLAQLREVSVCRTPGVAPTLITRLHRYAADVPVIAGESGPASYTRRAKHAKTPEYFSEFRERPDMTTFLGACIYAKVRELRRSATVLRRRSLRADGRRQCATTAWLLGGRRWRMDTEGRLQ